MKYILKNLIVSSLTTFLMICNLISPSFAVNYDYYAQDWIFMKDYDRVEIYMGNASENDDYRLRMIVSNLDPEIGETVTCTAQVKMDDEWVAIDPDASHYTGVGTGQDSNGYMRVWAWMVRGKPYVETKTENSSTCSFVYNGEVHISVAFLGLEKAGAIIGICGNEIMSIHSPNYEYWNDMRHTYAENQAYYAKKLAEDEAAEQAAQQAAQQSSTASTNTNTSTSASTNTTNATTYKYTKSVKYSKVKKKKQSVSCKLTGSTYKKATYKKVSGSGKLSVSSKGVVTVKKGTKKGTYTVKMKATVKKTKKTKAKSKTYNVKIKVV